MSFVREVIIRVLPEQVVAPEPTNKPLMHVECDILQVLYAWLIKLAKFYNTDELLREYAVRRRRVSAYSYSKRNQSAAG